MGALDGRVAIITGAGRGIGREHALLFAAEGAKVVVNDLGAGLHGEGSADVHPAQEVVELIKKDGGDADVNGDDISSWAGSKAVVEQAVDTFGSLDILVNNAGTSLAFRPIADESRQPLMETLEVNLWGPSCGQTWPGERGCASTEARSSTMHRPVGS